MCNNRFLHVLARFLECKKAQNWNGLPGIVYGSINLKFFLGGSQDLFATTLRWTGLKSNFFFWPSLLSIHCECHRDNWRKNGLSWRQGEYWKYFEHNFPASSSFPAYFFSSIFPNISQHMPRLCILHPERKTSQELRILASGTIDYQFTKIGMNSGSQLSEF